MPSSHLKEFMDKAAMGFQSLGPQETHGIPGDSERQLGNWESGMRRGGAIGKINSTCSTARSPSFII